MIRIRALLIVVVLALIGAAWAGDKSPDGKTLYKQDCRVCHDKGSSNGEYSPMSMIQDQWSTFFKARLAASHKEVKMPGTDKKLLEVLTPDQIKTIQKFCVDHAADSEQPQTCG